AGQRHEDAQVAGDPAAAERRIGRRRRLEAVAEHAPGRADRTGLQHHRARRERRAKQERREREARGARVQRGPHCCSGFDCCFALLFLLDLFEASRWVLPLYFENSCGEILLSLLLSYFEKFSASSSFAGISSLAILPSLFLSKSSNFVSFAMLVRPV